MLTCLSSRRVTIAAVALAASSFVFPEPPSRAADAASASDKPGSFEFASPVQLTTAEGAVSVESPGYACPAWADVDADGKKDLLVGQFNGGKIRVYKNQGADDMPPKLAAGEWLQAEGQVAEVPGVW